MPRVILRRDNALRSRTRARLRRRDPQILRAPRPPRVPIPVTTVTRAGVGQAVQVSADKGAGHEIENTGTELMLEIVSTDSSPQTFIIRTAALSDGIEVQDVPYTIQAGATMYINELTQGTFNQTGSKVFIDVPVSGTLKFRAYAT